MRVILCSIRMPRAWLHHDRSYLETQQAILVSNLKSEGWNRAGLINGTYVRIYYDIKDTRARPVLILEYMLCMVLFSANLDCSKYTLCPSNVRSIPSLTTLCRSCTTRPDQLRHCHILQTMCEQSGLGWNERRLLERVRRTVARSGRASEFERRDKRREGVGVQQRGKAFVGSR